MNLLISFILLFNNCVFAQTKEEIVNKITNVAKVSGLDPNLVLAIATVESNLDPNAVGKMNENGLFQLIPKFHYTIPGNAEHNMLVGIAYLMELHQRFGKKHKTAWFVAYNYGPSKMPKFPKKTDYYRKVMKVYNKLNQEKYSVKD